MNDDGPDAREVALSGLISGAVLGALVEGNEIKILWIVLGGVIGFAFSWLPTFIVGYFEQLLSPEMPVCAKGKCRPGTSFRGSDYESVWAKDVHPNYTHHYISSYKCRCGDTYVLQDNRFLKMSASGTELPFMVKVGRHWIDLQTVPEAIHQPGRTRPWTWFADNIMGFSLPCAAIGGTIAANLANNAFVGATLGFVLGAIVALLLGLKAAKVG